MLQKSVRHAPSASRDFALLHDPALNKDPALSADERRRFGLEGLLPPSTEGIDRLGPQFIPAMRGLPQVA